MVLKKVLYVSKYGDKTKAFLVARGFWFKKERLVVAVHL